MRTTINLPDELILKAMQATKCKTKTELFTMALNDIIQQHEIAKIKRYKGKINLDLNMAILRGR